MVVAQYQENINMQIDSINYAQKPTKKFVDWSTLNRQGQNSIRDHFADVTAVVIDKMKQWGYLIDNDASNKIDMANDYNRVDFLINVLPNLKKLFHKVFKS